MCLRLTLQRAYVTMDLSAMPCTDFVLDFTVLAISDGSQPDDTNSRGFGASLSSGGLITLVGTQIIGKLYDSFRLSYSISI